MIKSNSKKKDNNLQKSPEKKVEKAEKKDEEPKEKTEKSTESFEEEFEESSSQRFINSSRSFSLENTVMPQGPTSLDQIGEQEPKKDEKEDNPYTVKYDSSNYGINKNYKTSESTREETSFTHDSQVNKPRSTFNQIYSEARVQQESSGMDDLKSAEQGYLHSAGKRKNH